MHWILILVPDMKGEILLHGLSLIVEVACVIFAALGFYQLDSVMAQRSPSRIKLKRIKN